MKRMLRFLKLGCVCLGMVLGGLSALQAGGGSSVPTRSEPIPRALENYGDGHIEELVPLLKHRMKLEPFNAIATAIFFLAICHTFFSGYFRKKAHALDEIEKKQHKEKGGDGPVVSTSKSVLLHFLGEIEAIFGIWVVPLLGLMLLFFGWDSVTYYMDHQVHFVEPVFVMVIMSVASTRPILRFSEVALKQFAKIGGQTPLAWWLVLMTIAPLLGSFITEPAAMTISAFLLGERFFCLEPSNKLKYATIGLLFANVSVGGTLSHFAAPPILMVADRWGWTFGYVFRNFGTQALVGIAASTVFYLLYFRKEFKALNEKAKESSRQSTFDKKSRVPWWIKIVHLFFLAWTVFTLKHVPLFLGGFLFFLAFKQATSPYQDRLSLRSPLLVGFFLAGLVTHGALQQWWIAPVLSRLGEIPLFLGAATLTAFNDNAAITYLASLVPSFANNEVLQHAVVSGAVAAGGLTVIANAPNPAGQAILGRYFGKEGVSPMGLFLGSLAPTILIAIAFNFY